MNYITKRLFILFAIYVGCAAPSPRLEQQNFVPPEDLTVFRINNEGLRLASIGRLMEAEMQFRKALNVQPEVFPVKLNLAITLRELELYEEGEDLLLNLLSNQPNNIEVLSALGLLYFASQRNLVGNDALIKAIDIASKQERWDIASKNALLLAEAWYRMADMQQAICYSELAVNLQPSFESWQIYTRNLLEAGYYNKLLNLYNIRNIQPAQNGRLKLDQALAFLGLNEHQEGSRILERLKLTNKNYPELAIEITILGMLANTVIQFKDNYENIDFNQLTELENFEELKSAAEIMSNSNSKLRTWPVFYQKLLEKFLKIVQA